MKYSRQIRSGLTSSLAILGLGVLTTLDDAKAQTVTNLLSNTTFEDIVYDDEGNIADPGGLPRSPWLYSYVGPDNIWTDPYGNREAITAYGYPPENPTNLVTWFTFDSSLYTPVPSGAWYGFGFGAGMNWEKFNPDLLSSKREDYLLSFDAKAEGLLPGIGSGTMAMEVQIEAPDNTIPPEDENGDADRVLYVGREVQVGTNWTHFQFTLDDANVGSGSEANLAAFLLAISSINYNVNFPNPGDHWGFDFDNTVLVDNIKLQVISRAPEPELPTATVPIVDWNFDDKPNWNTYGGYSWSADNSYLPTFYYPTNLAVDGAGYGVDNSVGWFLMMDNSVFNQSVPAWAGGGTGGGGPADLSQFTSADLKAYKLSFDSRGVGLAEGTTSMNARLQVFFDSPNGEMRIDFDAPAGTNWVTSSYTLNQGAGSGAKAAFATNYNTITAVRTQWQIENATAAGWGYDANNVFAADNFKLLRIKPGLPPVVVTPNGTGLRITWGQPSAGTVKLQSAVSVEGPFSDVATSGTEYHVDLTGTQSFFRTVWVP